MTDTSDMGKERSDESGFGTKMEGPIQTSPGKNVRIRMGIERRCHIDEIVGYSEQMLEAFTLCEKVAASDITVLLQGETGTGKELVARCIHQSSQRREKLFMTQNCAGIQDTLLESELFGYKLGAFTGAMSDKRGLFEIAHGGTIFLDEVAEMSAAMQIALLRALQGGEIKPVGADFAKKVDVRVISATNRNLENDVRIGKFREDLFYRINAFTIDLPPLRERTGDIPVLVKFFMEKNAKKKGTPISDISPAALHCLETYRFPGNVRELENEMERAIAMAGAGRRIDVVHLSDKFQSKSSSTALSSSGQGCLVKKVEELEIRLITQALQSHGGNKTRAAEKLGLSRNGLMKKMKRYGL